MAVAGLNVLFFYTRVFRRLQQLPADGRRRLARAWPEPCR